MKVIDNNNTHLEQYSNKNDIQPILDGEKAATVSQTKFTQDTVISYDVKGTNIVRGSKFLKGPSFPGENPQYNVKMLTNIVNSATKAPYSDYCIGLDGTSLSASQIGGKAGKAEKFYMNVLANTFLVKPTVLENIVYINHDMYDPSYVITSTDYIDAYDSIVEDMVNASIDQYNEQSRRIAKLAKAIKNSVLAQTNDTNPLYTIRVSEIYDRLTDYFLKINRMVSTVYNIEGWLKSLDVLRYGTTVVAKKIDRFYTPDFQLRLKEKIGKLEAALHGCYYDPESLLDYINFSTVGYLNIQRGTPKFIAPVFYNSSLATYDTNLANTLAEITTFVTQTDAQIASAQEYILNTLDTYINTLYGGFFSYMQTALAPFNNIAMIDKIEYPGLSVKNKLINALACNTEINIGATCVSYRLKNGGTSSVDTDTSDTLAVITPAWKGGSDSSAISGVTVDTPQNNDGLTIAKGAVLNHNGFTEVAALPFTCDVTTGSGGTGKDTQLDLGYIRNSKMKAIVTTGDTYHEDDILLPVRLSRLGVVPVKNYYDSISPVYNDGWYNNQTSAVVGYSGNKITPDKFASPGKFKNDIFVSYFPIAHNSVVQPGISPTTVAYSAGAILHRGDVTIQGNIRIKDKSAWIHSSSSYKGLLEYAKGPSGIYTLPKPATVTDFSTGKLTPIVGFNKLTSSISAGDLNVLSPVDNAVVPLTGPVTGNDLIWAYCENKVTDGVFNWVGTDWLVENVADYISRQAIIFGFAIDRVILPMTANSWATWLTWPSFDASPLHHALIPDNVCLDEVFDVDLGKALYLNNMTD